MKLFELIGIIPDHQLVSLRDVDLANTQVWYGIFDDIPRMFRDYYVDLITSYGSKVMKINIYH